MAAKFKPCFTAAAACLLLWSVSSFAGGHAGTVLPSWQDVPSKVAIVQFVAAVTDPASPDFVPVPERIAVFDNDGCLWAEQPMYFQLAFAIDRVKALASEHPEWLEEQPFKAVLEGDLKTVFAGGEEALLELVMATHAGMTTDEFAAVVSNWLESAKHPTRDARFVDLVYQPMLEVLDYLRANGFKTFIASGGGIEFLRVFAEDVYGIPPEQVIGSTIKTELEVRGGEPVLARLPEINFIDDKAGKPVAINQHIGRRPIAAFGNSDGDLQMLQWSTAGEGRRLGVIIRHTDGEREWAYDRESSIGRLNTALDQAEFRGWVVVDMEQDWRQVFRAPPSAD